MTYSFTGRISAKRQGRDYRTKLDIYRLTIEGNKELDQIIIYQRKVSNEIWKEIEGDYYVNKIYLFSCEKNSLFLSSQRLKRN